MEMRRKWPILVWELITSRGEDSRGIKIVGEPNRKEIKAKKSLTLEGQEYLHKGGKWRGVLHPYPFISLSELSQEQESWSLHFPLSKHNDTQRETEIYIMLCRPAADPQQDLYFFFEPQGHALFRGIFCILASKAINNKRSADKLFLEGWMKQEKISIQRLLIRNNRKPYHQAGCCCLY